VFRACEMHLPGPLGRVVHDEDFELVGRDPPLNEATLNCLLQEAGATKGQYNNADSDHRDVSALRRASWLDETETKASRIVRIFRPVFRA
jgi:hypothetical protein